MRFAARSLIVVGAVLALSLAQASHISVSGPPPQLHLGVGTLGGAVDTVTFTVPANAVGDGTEIAGSQTVLIEVAVKRSGGTGGPGSVVLTVDSSAPLASGPDTIPWDEIRWDSADGVIPAGSFDTLPKTLLSFTAPNGTTRREDTHTFFFKNTSVPMAGIYNGTMIYTAMIF